MKYALLEQSQSIFLTTQKIAEILNISEASAQVLASRYKAKNLLISPKKNMFFLTSKKSRLSQNDMFYVSNLLQTPSYISLQTALSYYGISSQVTRGVILAVNPIRSCDYELDGIDFLYSKMKKELYFGFQKQENFFIALPEKAFLDSCYFEVYKKYSTDWSAIDFSKFNPKELEKMQKKIPNKVQEFASNLFKIYG